MQSLLYKIMFLLFCISLLWGCASITQAQEKSNLAATYNVELGLGYLQKGNLTRAKAKLLLALNQSPNWPLALDAMGYFLEKTGSPEEAENYYKRAVVLAPKDGKVLNNYGAYLCRQKNKEKAEMYFLAAVKDPNYLTLADAYENAGLCALTIPNESKAMIYFEKALVKNPQQLSSIQELAKLHFKQKNYSQTLKYIDQYLAYSNKNSHMLYLGYCAAFKMKNSSAESRYNALLKHKQIRINSNSCEKIQ
ncbi:MAG: hypothetical protein LEGION0398_MBIBDBAK_01320 [Legionellaceae bacterium]